MQYTYKAKTLLMYVDDSTHIPGLPSILFLITYNMQNWRRKGWEHLSHEWHQGLPIGKQKEVGISMVQTILGYVVSIQMLESWLFMEYQVINSLNLLVFVRLLFEGSVYFVGKSEYIYCWIRYVRAIQWRLLDAVSSKWSLLVLWKQVVQHKQPWNKTWVPLPPPPFLPV